MGVVTSSYLGHMLAGLDQTVDINIRRVRCGFWDQVRPIIIILDSLDIDNVDLLVGNKYFARHPNILVLAPSKSRHLIMAARHVRQHFW